MARKPAKVLAFVQITRSAASGRGLATAGVSEVAGAEGVGQGWAVSLWSLTRKRSDIFWKTRGKRSRASSTSSIRGLRSSQLRKHRRVERTLSMLGGRRGKTSPFFLNGGNKMKKEIIKGLGNIAEEIAREVVGKSLSKNRNVEDTAGNIADSIIDDITGALGGGDRGKGRSGGGQGRCGQGRGGGRGSGGMRGRGGGR